MQSDPEATTRSAPESPIIGLIENSDAAACQEAGTSGTPKESAPKAEKSSLFADQLPPSAAAKEADTAAADTSGEEAGGSGKSTV